MTCRHFKRAVLLCPLLISIVLSGGVLYAHEPIFSLGPETIFKGGIGVEVEAEYFEKTRLLRDGRVVSDPLDRENRGLKLNTEIIYGVTEDLSLTLSVPHLSLEKEETSGGRRIKKNSSGTGDLLLRGKYRLYKRQTPGVTVSLSPVFGIKLPTGDNDKDPALGTGSVDLLGGLAAGYESRRWYAFGDLRYRLNTKADNVKEGNALNYDLVFGARPWLTEYDRPDLVVLVEFNGEYEQKDRTGSERDPDSGGNTISISPGMLFSYRNVMFKAGIKIPISQELNGTQLGEDYEVVTALEAHF